jgi:hypothetical protein
MSLLSFIDSAKDATYQLIFDWGSEPRAGSVGLCSGSTMESSAERSGRYSTVPNCQQQFDSLLYFLFFGTKSIGSSLPIGTSALSAAGRSSAPPAILGHDRMSQCSIPREIPSQYSTALQAEAMCAVLNRLGYCVSLSLPHECRYKRAFENSLRTGHEGTRHRQTSRIGYCIQSDTR